MATINYPISILRNDPSFVPILTDLYFTIDSGQEGFWKFDPLDITSTDNTGLIIVTLNNSRLKRIFDGYVNVKWFGAKGDGITDDTDAIQLGINVLQNTPIVKNNLAYGTLYFPSGIYLVSGLSLLDINQDNYQIVKINFLGDGMWYSIIQYFSPFEPIDSECISILNPVIVPLIFIKSPFVTIKDLGFQGAMLKP